MAKSIQTVRGRDALRVRREPHWLPLSRGCHLGFRKMSIAGDGVWVAKYRDPDSGKRFGVSLGHYGELPANERFDAARTAATEWFSHMGLGGSGKATTVAAACAAYVDHLRAAGREATASDAEARFKRWVNDDALGKIELQKLTHPRVTDWRRRLAKTKTIPQDKENGERKDRSEASLNRDMATLRAALNHALRERHVTTDAAWKVALQPVVGADSRRQVYLEPQQRRALLNAAPADLQLFVRGLSSLPLRPGALAKLTVSDFDSRINVVRIKKDKSGRSRHIQLPKNIAEFFEKLVEEKKPEDPLFSRGDGGAWNKDSWKKPFKQAVIAAKLPADASAYSLRHSTITDLIVRHKLDLMTVAILSDTSIAMIERHYGHLVSDRATRALGKLAI